MINPANTNLVPISRNPSVNAFTSMSIVTNENPNKNTRIPMVINTLNRDKSFLVEILLHHHNFNYLNNK